MARYQLHITSKLGGAADNVADVDDYLDTRSLCRSALVHHLLQALIELAAAGSEERSLLECISNHVNARGGGAAGGAAGPDRRGIAGCCVID